MVISGVCHSDWVCCRRPITTCSIVYIPAVLVSFMYHVPHPMVVTHNRLAQALGTSRYHDQPPCSDMSAMGLWAVPGIAAAQGHHVVFVAHGPLHPLSPTSFSTMFSDAPVGILQKI